MKFTLIVATLALVSGIDLHRNTTAHGIADESYDTKLDGITAGVTAAHKADEAWKTRTIKAEENSNVWRGVKDNQVFGPSF